MPKPKPLKGCASSRPEAQNLSALCRAYRQKMGLTQEQLGHMVGVSFATINRWEVGRTRPNARTMDALERLLVNAGLRPVAVQISSIGDLAEWARGYLLLAIGKGEFHYAVEHVVEKAMRIGYENGRAPVLRPEPGNGEAPAEKRQDGTGGQVPAVPAQALQDPGTKT